MSSKAAGFSRPSRKRKSRRNPAASSRFRPIEAGPRSEPVGAAAVAVIPVAIAVAIHAMLVAAMAFAALGPALHMVGQDGEAAFLAVVQRLVERVSRVGDLLHRCRRAGHVVGAFAQAGHRIVRLLRAVIPLGFP